MIEITARSESEASVVLPKRNPGIADFCHSPAIYVQPELHLWRPNVSHYGNERMRAPYRGAAVRYCRRRDTTRPSASMIQYVDDHPFRNDRGFLELVALSLASWVLIGYTAWLFS